MRRDLGNEIIVAIVAVAVLAFALTFGIILSLSGAVTGSVGAPTNVDPLPANPTRPVIAATRSTPTSPPTPTLVLTPTTTSVSAAAAIATQNPTESPTLTPEPPPTCVPSPPDDWITYTVRRGDTITAIARASSSTVAELQRINCISDANRIQVGTVLYVPAPAMAATREPVALLAVGCTDDGAQITTPIPGATLAGDGLIVVRGTAAAERFWFYRLEIRADRDTVYMPYLRAETPVEDAALGEIDLARFGTGLHWVRLSVIEAGGEIRLSPCAIPVIFE